MAIERFENDFSECFWKLVLKFFGLILGLRIVPNGT